jgi:hypothetical protein
LDSAEVVNYRSNPDWHEAVRKLTGGRGVDYVIEVGSTIEAARQLLGPKHQSFVHCYSPWIFAKTVREPRPTKLLERFSSNYSH